MLLSSHSKLLFFYSFYQNWFLIKNFQKILYSRIIIKDRVWIKNDSLERELRWEDLSDPCCSTGSRVPVTPGPYSPPQSTHNRGWLTEDWTRLLLTCLFYKFSYVASEWVGAAPLLKVHPVCIQCRYLSSSSSRPWATDCSSLKWDNKWAKGSNCCYVSIRIRLRIYDTLLKNSRINSNFVKLFINIFRISSQNL